MLIDPTQLTLLIVLVLPVGGVLLGAFIQWLHSWVINRFKKNKEKV
jgi:NhaP-type Na+/H+ or K+/H+ antiporter